MLIKLHFNNLTIYSILGFGFIVGLILIIFTDNSYGGSDSVQHYNLAHWGWKHPELLFDHWGKPIFTILISPIAQIGINGARVYNLVLGFATAVLIWRIAQTLKFKNSGLSIFFVLFTPVYFMLMFTPLTEVSFSFFLVLSVLLFFKKKYYFSAILLSFIPILRTEGIVLLPLFITAYILRKKILAIPLLFTGFMIISIVGYSYYDDFWWLITKMPYSGDAKVIYGSGSILHFIYNTRDTRGILGFTLGILFVIGTIASIIHWVKKDNYRFSHTYYFLLLIPGSYIVFLLAHSIAWWQGIGNSLGLLRVMGSVTPLAALTALIGYNSIIDFINKKNTDAGKITKYSILLLIFLITGYNYRGGFKLERDQLIIKQTSTYVKENNLVKHKIYYFDPYLIFELGIDPYDKTRNSWGVPNVENPSIGIPDSSIIIWDAHFGPNEGRVSLDDLQNQRSLNLIKTIKPDKPFNVLGGYNYEVYIFMKSNSLSDKLMTIISFDFETDENGSTAFSYTGNMSQHITSNMTYSNSAVSYLQEIFDTISDINITAKGYIYIEKPIEGALPLVCALQLNNQNHYYKTFELKNQVTKVGQWNHFEHVFRITNASSPEELLKVYIWNNNKQDFYLDDFEITIETSRNQTNN